MNWHSQIVYQCLWCAHPILQLAVAVALWRRKLYRRFPVFFTYILAQIAIFAVTFPLWRAGNYEWFFWSYWLGAVVSAILGFKVIHEVFLDVFRPYHTLKDLGTVVFRWAGVVMLMVSAVVAFSNSPNHSPLVHAVTTLAALGTFGAVRAHPVPAAVFAVPGRVPAAAELRDRARLRNLRGVELVLLALSFGGLAA